MIRSFKRKKTEQLFQRSQIAPEWKPIAHNETEEQLKTKYEQQRKRHIEAYEHATGGNVSIDVHELAL